MTDEPMTATKTHDPACECRRCAEESQERVLGYMGGHAMAREEFERLQAESLAREALALKQQERWKQRQAERMAAPCPTCGLGVDEFKYGQENECRSCEGVARKRDTLVGIGVAADVALDVARKMKTAELWFHDE